MTDHYSQTDILQRILNKMQGKEGGLFDVRVRFYELECNIPKYFVFFQGYVQDANSNNCIINFRLHATKTDKDKILSFNSVFFDYDVGDSNSEECEEIVSIIYSLKPFIDEFSRHFLTVYPNGPFFISELTEIIERVNSSTNDICRNLQAKNICGKLYCYAPSRTDCKEWMDGGSIDFEDYLGQNQ